MSLINKMNVGNTNYDIQDRLMPDAIGQAGQVLRVKDDASGLEFSDTESGGKMYQHYVVLNHSVYGTSVIIFNSNNSEKYTFDSLKSYISKFTRTHFVCLFKKEDTASDFIFIAYALSESASIDIWYETTYGDKFVHDKQASELVSDTVTEL